jgi:hypothetical protein
VLELGRNARKVRLVRHPVRFQHVEHGAHLLEDALDVAAFRFFGWRPVRAHREGTFA